MKRLLCLVTFGLGWPALGAAQIPVTDAALLAQGVVQAAQTVYMIANQVIELTGLGSIVSGDDLSNDIDTLVALGGEAKGLVFDIANIQRQMTTLFNIDTAPSNSRALQVRMAEVRRLSYTLYCDAVAVQSLLQSSLSALRHLTRLIEGIGDMLGNQQSNQTLAQLDSRLIVEMAKLRATTESYQRAEMIDRLSEPLVLESIQRINIEIMTDWPRD